MTQRFIGTWMVIAACACATPAIAQNANDDAEPGKLARLLQRAEAIVNGVDGVTEGVHPELGVSIVGGGPAGGVGYRLPMLDHRVVVDASAVLSVRGYKDVQTRVEMPRLASGRLGVGADLRYEDGTQINYFGIGANSSVNSGADYRLRYFDAAGFATFHLSQAVSITGRAGVLQGASVTGGTSSVMPSIETRFENAAAPGLGLQPDFAHADIALDVDTRDVPGYPRSGGRYRAAFAAYHDRGENRFSFQRIEGEAAQYLPIGDRSVASLHARVDASRTADGQQVPFYLLPSLGSGQSLRGYDDYRFRDRDALLASAEWRTHLVGLFDVAGFVDTGSVAPTFGTLASNHLLSDFGVGLRVHSASRLIVRLDVARGTEGMHTILSFSPSLAFSKRIVAPFIP